MKRDSLGDRIKRYEGVTRHYGTRRMPLVVRVDGKAFHTYTKHAEKPFDKTLIKSMVDSARYVAGQMQGFKVAYVQSDEATFVLTDYDDVNTAAWFDYNISKIVSISAAYMTAAFNRCMPANFSSSLNLPVFDARAFNVPREDVVNTLLWRAQDWKRNSMQMYARANFSHRELHGKNVADMHEMLHTIGKNWTTDLTLQQKNGTFLYMKDGKITEDHSVLPVYGDILEKVWDGQWN